MANFIEELYHGNIESQNMKKKKSKVYSREMKILSENEDVLLENFPKKIKSCFLNMLTLGVLLTENLLLIVLLPDSDLERSLPMIHLHLRKHRLKIC